MNSKPVYANCKKCGAVMDGLRQCPKCGYRKRGRPLRVDSARVVIAKPAGEEPPTPQPQGIPSSVSEPMEKAHEKPPRVTVTVSIEVHVDCGNPASVDAFRKLLKELSA